ncbi:MAG: beta-lactamase family protein [Planctomycetaceae bacterium]|nr:beta-lactamase family protein [Planctomycetaceae bacterium]
MNCETLISRRSFLAHSGSLPMLGSLFISRLSAEEKKPSSPFASVEQVLQHAVTEKAFPGCAAAVGTADRVLWSAGFGNLSLQKTSQVTTATLYDLASLTKVVGTTSVAVRLIAQSKLNLDDPLVEWIPEFVEQTPNETAKSRGQITVRHLLTHTSGLPAWKPIYQTANSYRETIDLICKTELERTPGENYRYSDLGMMLMGEVLARAGDARLDVLEQRLIFEPLKMTATRRNPAADQRSSIAPTERIGESEEFYRGVVHDENARGGEGVTGHAGLFSNVTDLSNFCQAWLSAVRGSESIFSTKLAREFASRQKIPGDARRGLGWQMFSAGSSGGSRLSESAFGHTGFTGTSLWIDPEKNLFFILLGNRVHPTRKNSRHIAVRREFADAVVRAVDSL